MRVAIIDCYDSFTYNLYKLVGQLGSVPLPLLQREDWVGSQSIGLLDRLFGGQLAPLVAQFSSQRKLSAADRAALKKLLEDDGDA